MRIAKKTYYYNPLLRMGDLGYTVDIYEYNGRRPRLIHCYSGRDYAKVLLQAREYVDFMTKRQQ